MDVLAGGDGETRFTPVRRIKLRPSLSFSPGDMFLFRAPQPTYLATAWPGELCVLGSSVCLALERSGGASTVALFCHGTSSDLGMARRSLDTLRERLDCHVVAVEYPGYGLAKEEEPSEGRLNEAVRSVYLYLTGPMGWSADRIVVIGRSLGSGPASRLAREFQPGALILLAPFSSVKDIAGAIVGDTLANVFNLNHWNNLEQLRETTTPTLLLHGLKDEVVPHLHSLDLYRSSSASQKYVALLYDSDHNRVDWRVACDVYARPFLEKSCPTEINRSLGVRARDVRSLAQFIDPKSTTNAASVLARAEAAWRKRRANGGVTQEAAIEAGELAIRRAEQARATAAAEALAAERATRQRAEEDEAAARAKQVEEASLLPQGWNWSRGKPWQKWGFRDGERAATAAEGMSGSRTQAQNISKATQLSETEGALQPDSKGDEGGSACMCGGSGCALCDRTRRADNRALEQRGHVDSGAAVCGKGQGGGALGGNAKKQPTGVNNLLSLFGAAASARGFADTVTDRIAHGRVNVRAPMLDVRAQVKGSSSDDVVEGDEEDSDRKACKPSLFRHEGTDDVDSVRSASVQGSDQASEANAARRKSGGTGGWHALAGFFFGDRAAFDTQLSEE